MGRFVWIVVIERDGEGLRGWVKWAVVGLAIIGLVGVAVWRLARHSGIF